jgi:predicted AAA+ superfamily ATPase
MKRFIDLNLAEWSQKSQRKPLLLRGARQVGKTFAVRQLGRTFAQFIEINFEEEARLKEIFEFDLRPERILRELSVALNKTIVPGEALLFFDEIQDSPKVISALRYFYEEMPDLHIIAAGSLLDFTLENISVPVGRLSTFYLYPLSWIEFLLACDETLLYEEILKCDINNPISSIIHEKALRLLGEYMAIGGMPEAVQNWITNKDPRACFEIHNNLIDFYRQDFHKYAKKNKVGYVELLFANVSYQISKKFKFSLIPGEYRKRELSPALDLLEKAGVIHKVHYSAGQGLPLGAQIDLDKFKVLFLDIALAQALLGLDLSDWFINPGASLINKGALVEAFIGQELLAYSNPIKKASLYYWQRDAKNSQAEVDYLIQHEGKIIPIEVKSNTGKTLRSMHLFLEGHPESPYGVKFSAHNYSVFEKIYSYPLYAVFKFLNRVRFV